MIDILLRRKCLKKHLIVNLAMLKSKNSTDNNLYPTKVCMRGKRKIFVGLMKCFRHIVMGHEIFFKIFDWPQNIFLCSLSVILFFKFF